MRDDVSTVDWLQRRGIFPISANDLLIVRNDARLARRRTIAHGKDTAIVDRLFAQHAPHVGGKSILANRADEFDARTECDQIVGHVARAAECERVIRNRDDRDGRFR